MNVESCMRGMLLLYLAGSLGYMLFAAFGRRLFRIGAQVLTGLAFAVHSVLLTHRVWLARRPPLTNMYETLVFFAWLLVVVSMGVEWKYRVRALGAFTLPIVFLLLAATSLIASSIEPLVPALKSNWLLIHVLTCFVAYAAFAVAFACSLLFLFLAGARRRGAGRPPSRERQLMRLDALTYRMITLGFPFLTIGIVTGSVWADLCWGTYWSWDPKETWSLVTWLIYGACLHLRHVSGLRGGWAAAASVFGFVSVMCTYFGVNYLFSSLHAYA